MMKISLTKPRKEVSKDTRRGKLVMMLFVANLMALNTVFAQENKGDDKSKSSRYTIAYSWNGINLTDNEGKSKNKILASGGYAAWSPDGKRIAFYAKYDERKTWSIHTMNSDGTNWKRLTHVKNKWDNSPTWSPDGTKIAFSREYEDSEKNWQNEVWIMNSDGSQLTQIKPIKGGGPYFTPDGRIVFHSEYKNGVSGISIADVDGSNIIQLTQNEAEEQHPEVSPNGMQIAFMSDRDGNGEIYVMDIDGSNQKRLTSSKGFKWYPSWSPDGSKLIFSSTTEDGKRNIYMMNKDGSSVKKIISNGTQPAWSKVAKDPDSPRLTEQSEPAVSLGEISSLQSKVLNKTIPLSIHLPENYDNSKKTYPVLYMLGSDYRARFAMLASTLDYMGGGQIPEMILIGIDLPEGNRILLPTRDNQDTTIPDGYINFFETELIPHVDNKYRTAPFKVLFGASNSGFFSVYTLLNNPLLFNGYFASSPSLSIIPTELQQKIKSGPLKALSENRFLHIIYSDDEGLTNHVSEFTRVLADHKPESFTYKVDELVNQGHVPAMDFTQFLVALYPDYNPYENLNTLDKVTQHFDRLSKRYGYEILPPMSTIFNLGRDMIYDEKNLVAAEKIFQYSLQVYPENKKSYLGMGVVRRDQGQLESAKAMFEKALTIDPDYSNAKSLLQKLEK